LHALSFPGLFSPRGLLGAGPQTTAWLYMFWHGGFLLAAAYSIAERRAPPMPCVASDGRQCRGAYSGERGTVLQRRRPRQRPNRGNDKDLRLGELGQMVSALAHAVNQPPTAIGNYIRASERFLEQGDPERARVR
jgi:hypothetical protein